jgi:hypothetical protein
MTPPKRLELQLENSAVSDHGPASLEALKNVVQVDFGRRISDEGVAHLAKLAGLERLAFFGSKLTDHALDHLVGTKALHRLNLECKKVTDVGLGELHELKKLKELFIRGPRITEAGVDEIRKAIPGLQVSRWP